MSTAIMIGPLSAAIMFEQLCDELSGRTFIKRSGGSVEEITGCWEEESVQEGSLKSGEGV